MIELYEPKQYTIEVGNHDGTKESCEEIAKWINDHGQEHDAQVVPNGLEDGFLVEYVVESGTDFVDSRMMLVFNNWGEFELHTAKSFETLFKKHDPSK